jgi:hypothetical protein
MGNRALAIEHYRKLLQVASAAGADRPELVEARTFVGARQ